MAELANLSPISVSHRRGAVQAIPSHVNGLFQPGYCTFGAFTSRGLAEHLEAALITCLPQTSNRTHWAQSEAFWAPVRPSNEMDNSVTTIPLQ